MSVSSVVQERQLDAAVRAASGETPEREAVPSASIERYETALGATIGWLLRSVEHGRGGSCAYFGSWGRWSKPYPETTGYLIPTLLAYARRSGDPEAREVGVRLGTWLLQIQEDTGYWYGGMHPGKQALPSVFNTAQILLGLCALYRETREEAWLDAARRAAAWLAGGVDADGRWRMGNYRDDFNPAYYTRVAWPMLEVAGLTEEASIQEAAERVLRAIIAERKENGAFRGWGFAPQAPAFTHTIAYTLRGLLESARLCDDWEAYGQPAEAALERLFRQAELSRGRLAGTYDDAWKKDTRFTCLTGNVQTALCLLRYEARVSDLRLVNAACKLVDQVCASQALQHPIAGIRGGVAGSNPLWGRYMTLRYPNWAAKFHADALMLLLERLHEEGV